MLRAATYRKIKVLRECPALASYRKSILGDIWPRMAKIREFPRSHLNTFKQLGGLTRGGAGRHPDMDLGTAQWAQRRGPSAGWPVSPHIIRIQNLHHISKTIQILS
ncbi:hypothetical protein Zmor_023243 [Zophobas morio]|uniref:Uncharacterized protein n=1 Tax=Zophobas morio TaxID=2755281 RepID=A0AA38HXL7_9CUCU|nr:hypothetical protein Zmor_023243 [Zophobas morio]